MGIFKGCYENKNRKELLYGFLCYGKIIKEQIKKVKIDNKGIKILFYKF